MPKHAAHATLERERTLSRIVADDEPVSPAALEECFGVLPLGDADFEMLDIVGVSDADELDLDVADLVEVGRTAAMQATQELAAAANSAAEAARLEQAALKEKARQEKAAAKAARLEKAAAKAEEEEARVLQAVVNSLIVRVQAAAKAAREVERAAEREQKAAKAAARLEKVAAKDAAAAAAGAGAKRRRYSCGKCRVADLPAEGHMASQAVCPCFGMPPPSRKAVAAAFLAARPQTAEAMRQRKIARQKERRAEQRRAQDEEDTDSD